MWKRYLIKQALNRELDRKIDTAEAAEARAVARADAARSLRSLLEVQEQPAWRTGLKGAVRGAFGGGLVAAPLALLMRSSRPLSIGAGAGAVFGAGVGALQPTLARSTLARARQGNAFYAPGLTDELKLTPAERALAAKLMHRLELAHGPNH